MANFRKGDRVRCIHENYGYGIKYLSEGVVVNVTRTGLLVLWDEANGDKSWWMGFEDVELVEQKEVDSEYSGSIEIKHNITEEELSKIIDELGRRPILVQSWDDSIEFTPTEMPKIDRFTFGYEDDYGMEITHKFHGTEFEYGLVDVIANFSLFLRGVGYTDEEIGEFINEGRM